MAAPGVIRVLLSPLLLDLAEPETLLIPLRAPAASGAALRASVVLGGPERVVEIGTELATSWPDVVFLSGITCAVAAKLDSLKP
ncbi:MAG: hypothetical protein JWQ47_1777 [Glaciihabitans sp.]|nr:hypothetical protein [Glaciihabitans sp.]